MKALRLARRIGTGLCVANTLAWCAFLAWDVLQIRRACDTRGR